MAPAGPENVRSGNAEPDEGRLEDGLQRALGVAYAYLNRRERTAAEVRRRLASAGSDDTTIDEALAVLGDQGVIDDLRFARLFAQDKRELEQWGSDRIQRTLRERGIARDLVEQALREDAAGDEADQTELHRALVLLRRRFPVAPRGRRERDRALGVLLRKGYDGEVAVDALAVYAREQREAPDPPADLGDQASADLDDVSTAW